MYDHLSTVDDKKKLSFKYETDHILTFLSLLGQRWCSLYESLGQLFAHAGYLF